MLDIYVSTAGFKRSTKNEHRRKKIDFIGSHSKTTKVKKKKPKPKTEKCCYRTLAPISTCCNGKFLTCFEEQLASLHKTRASLLKTIFLIIHVLPTERWQWRGKRLPAEESLYWNLIKLALEGWTYPCSSFTRKPMCEGCSPRNRPEFRMSGMVELQLPGPS